MMFNVNVEKFNVNVGKVQCNVNVEMFNVAGQRVEFNVMLMWKCSMLMWNTFNVNVKSPMWPAGWRSSM